jgi:hypothetical protein
VVASRGEGAVAGVSARQQEGVGATMEAGGRRDDGNEQWKRAVGTTRKGRDEGRYDDTRVEDGAGRRDEVVALP